MKLAAITITLDSFQDNQSSREIKRSANQISQYLHQALKHQKKYKKAQFPSITQLSGYFNCPCLEIYDAFRLLRSQGFDFTFTGLDTPVYVWADKGKV